MENDKRITQRARSLQMFSFHSSFDRYYRKDIEYHWNVGGVPVYRMINSNASFQYFH